MKLILTALLFLCSLATVLQFLSSRPSLSPFDLSLCASKLSSSSSSETSTTPLNLSASSDPNPVSVAVKKEVEVVKEEEVKKVVVEEEEVKEEVDSVGSDGIIKRVFNPYGLAAYLFVKMSAYRGGLNTFAVVGLASKPLHIYGKPQYECEWRYPANADASNSSVRVSGQQILPDWGYGRVYTVVVVNCTFPTHVGTNGTGGRLILRASTGEQDERDKRVEEIVALVEKPGSLNTAAFTAPPQYDYLYCGSSLYGNLSPQRMREWIAYHVRLFGKRSHFVIHDAGGVHPEMLEVLRPWMEIGYVTLQDIRDQERFDGYYHNQFMIVNDCLHRYRFMAKWMFFFDIDEYIYVPPKSTIASVLASLSDYTQFTIEQMPMSHKLCRESDKGNTARKWGFEKLLFKDVKKGIRRDRKYAIQPRNVFATGVHMSQNMQGKTTHKTEGRIMYFHYHGTIAERREPCREFTNATWLTSDQKPYVLDQTLRFTAGAVKRFELKTIGTRLQRTRQ